MVLLTFSVTVYTYIRKFQYQTFKKVINELKIIIILMSGVRLYWKYVGLTVERFFLAAADNNHFNVHLNRPAGEYLRCGRWQRQ